MRLSLVPDPLRKEKNSSIKREVTHESSSQSNFSSNILCYALLVVLLTLPSGLNY